MRLTGLSFVSNSLIWTRSILKYVYEDFLGAFCRLNLIFVFGPVGDRSVSDERQPQGQAG